MKVFDYDALEVVDMPGMFVPIPDSECGGRRIEVELPPPSTAHVLLTNNLPKRLSDNFSKSRINNAPYLFRLYQFCNYVSIYGDCKSQELGDLDSWMSGIWVAFMFMAVAPEINLEFPESPVKQAEMHKFVKKYCKQLKIRTVSSESLLDAHVKMIQEPVTNYYLHMLGCPVESEIKSPQDLHDIMADLYTYLYVATAFAMSDKKIREALDRRVGEVRNFDYSLDSVLL